jgi:hypothetical protein
MKAINNYTKITITATIILLFMLAVVWSGTDQGVSIRSLKRIDKEGPVDITATYLNPLGKAGDSELRFEVKLDTHDVDLEQYELKEISFISFDDGKESKSIGSNREGYGHHITYILLFAGPIPAEARTMTLIIRNVGDVTERSLEWKLPVK